MPTKQKLFNREKFVECLLGDEALAQSIGYYVLRDFQRNLDGLKTALSKKDKAEIIFYIHGIKGVAATAHCDRLFELSRHLEENARSGESSVCLENMEELIDLTNKSSEHLRAYLKEPENEQ